MGIIIVALLALMIISAIFGIIRGVFRGALSVVLFIIIGGLAGYAYLNDIHDPITLVSSIVTKFENEEPNQTKINQHNKVLIRNQHHKVPILINTLYQN